MQKKLIIFMAVWSWFSNTIGTHKMFFQWDFHYYGFHSDFSHVLMRVHIRYQSMYISYIFQYLPNFTNDNSITSDFLIASIFSSLILVNNLFLLYILWKPDCPLTWMKDQVLFGWKFISANYFHSILRPRWSTQAFDNVGIGTR